MSNINNMGFMVAGISAGLTVTTAVASASSTLPTASGAVPRFVRVSATTESYVRLGVAGVVATANDLLVQPADAAILAIPNGITTIAYIQGTSAGKVNISPLEAV